MDRRDEEGQNQRIPIRIRGFRCWSTLAERVDKVWMPLICSMWILVRIPPHVDDAVDDYDVDHHDLVLKMTLMTMIQPRM